MPTLATAPYRAFEVTGVTDMARVHSLRWQVFWQARGLADGPGDDGDVFDRLCRHVLVERTSDGTALATFRLMILSAPGDLTHSYCAQYYDLTPLANWPAPMAELGRFCVAPQAGSDPEILRLCWATLARILDGVGVTLLFGATSFAGADPDTHAPALHALWRDHLGPPALRPRALVPVSVPDAKGRKGRLPSLLQTYLALGGWVGEGAVVDPDLDTLHVFTALELARIPPARQKFLRAKVL